jgi:hypothetical protein
MQEYEDLILLNFMIFPGFLTDLIAEVEKLFELILVYFCKIDIVDFVNFKGVFVFK